MSSAFFCFACFSRSWRPRRIWRVKVQPKWRRKTRTRGRSAEASRRVFSGGEFVGLCGFFDGVGGGARWRDAGVCPDGGPDDEDEGWNPDQVIDAEDDEGGDGYPFDPNITGDDDDGRYEFQQTEEDDGPMAQGIGGCEQEGEAEESRDEADGAPEHHCCGRLHADAVEAIVRPAIRPDGEADVIGPSKNKGDTHPAYRLTISSVALDGHAGG